MHDTKDLSYHPIVEELAKVLCKKTQSTDPQFFRILISYYMVKVASMMRTNIITKDRGIIPVSMYAVNLAPSGLGKGHSTNIVEEQIINEFRKIFLHTTFKEKTSINLARIALERAERDNIEEEVMLERIVKEFDAAGELLFSFDSGTVPAIKQFRHKLLLANAGSMNFETDEIGSNLLGNMDALGIFLELYDIGKAKPKIIKNTADNRRVEEIDGRTPTNMMLFGTPDTLLNGGKEEDEFIKLLLTGYARRCFFGYTKLGRTTGHRDPAEVYAELTDGTTDEYLKILSDNFATLATEEHFNIMLEVPDEVGIHLTSYRIDCEDTANSMSEFRDMEKAELTHRYFKTLKLAGAYAFYDHSPIITKEHIDYAIKVAEDSGIAFEQILRRDKNYIKLAKYIASAGKELTNADIVEDLSFYKGAAIRKELLDLAVAWGYRNNVIIKKVYDSDIEFLQGESLEETDPNKIIISYSKDITKGYNNKEIPWNKVHKITEVKDYHFCTHQLKDNYRDSAHAIPGFNLIVIDIDEGVSMDTAKLLLKEYTFLMYETKRSTPQANRFRMIFPTNFILKLIPKEFSSFMESFFEWLPFEVDNATKDIARSWATYPKKAIYNQGETIDVLPFIPKTKKSEEHKIFLNTYQNMDAMEKWMLRTTDSGNRSNQLIKYAFLLIDTGLNQDSIQLKVIELNKKLPEPLEEAEILNTIMKSVEKKILEKQL